MQEPQPGTRIVGPDGELLVDVPITTPKPPSARRFFIRLAIVMLATLLLLLGAYYWLVRRTSNDPSAIESGSNPYVPADIFAQAQYMPAFISGSAADTRNKLPCAARYIYGQITPLQAGLFVRIFDDAGKTDFRTLPDANGNYQFTFGGLPQTPLKLWVYNSSRVVAGLSNLKFGEGTDFPYCVLGVNFK